MARPVLKWAGGKTQLLPEILKRLPARIETYYEPFVGGGAVFFALATEGRFKRAVLSDTNRDLIRTYTQLRDKPETVIAHLRELAQTHSKEQFYEVRQQFNDGRRWCPDQQAAYFIYLNKTCFTPGSQILLENETWQPIEEVAKGDRLWNGRVVSEVLSRPYYGTIRRIRVQGSPWTVSVTEDHPILSVSGKGSAKQEKRTAIELLQEMDLCNARYLKPGDYVFLPATGITEKPIDWHGFWPKDSIFGPQIHKQRLTGNPQDADVARLLGYYAAEGHIAYQASHKDGSRGRIKSVVWTFHTNERDTYIADLEAICLRLFGIRPKVSKGVGNKFQVELNSVQVAAFVKTLVPGQSWAKLVQDRKTKRLHTVLMTLSPSIQIELLKAWLRGDGGLRHKKSGNTSELCGTCTVLPMARQMYRLAQRCGLKPSWRITHPRGRTHHLDGTAIDNTTAHVSFSSDDVQTLGFKVLPRKRKLCEQRRFMGGYLCVRIKAILDLPYVGSVHNIEVDGNHLICVDGVISHNCFNGLYRVNSRGDFNTPFGDYKKPTICDEDNLRAVHKALQGAELCTKDFERTRDEMIRRIDCVYFDPPYLPVSKTSNFTAYSGGFGIEQHHQLAHEFSRLARAGVPVLLSNSDVPAVRELYRDWQIETVNARRSINSKGAKRGAVSEVLVTGKKATKGRS